VNRIRISLAAGALALVLAACTEAGSDSTAASPASPGLLPLEEITVTDALGIRPGGPFVITGYLVVDGGQARLCEALAESFPPQCGGAALRLEGLDLEAVEFPVQTEGAVTWTDGAVSLTGVLDGDIFTVQEIQS